MEMERNNIMPKLNEINSEATYTINQYSVWLEVHLEGDEDRVVLIHPNAIENLTKALTKAKEIASANGEKAVRDWDQFVLSQDSKGARFARTSTYNTRV